jgi:hypothetical protein
VQGAEIVLKLRPVDLLRQLLVENRGPESEAVKLFFEMQKEEQACATSLILACLQSAHNLQVAEWATRAFFMYGGEPKIRAVATPVALPTFQYSMTSGGEILSMTDVKVTALWHVTLCCNCTCCHPRSVAYVVYVGLQTVLVLKNCVFWNVVPFGSYRNRRFGGT